MKNDFLRIGFLGRYIKILIISFWFFTANLVAEDIPINDLLYSVTDFGFTLAPSGKHMASIKKRPQGYILLITDIHGTSIKSRIPLGNSPVTNLSWISEFRITYEQTGTLNAINIDGTEKQQLMSILKNKDVKRYYYVQNLLKNLQTSKMINVLEEDFEHVLIETRGINNYPIIYKLNIFTGDKEEIENGKKYKINNWLIDKSGRIRFGIQYDDDKIKFLTKTDKGKWKSNNDLNLDIEGNSFINQKLNFMDFDYNENIIYLASSEGSPRWQLLAYDIQQKTYVDTILADFKYDIGNPIYNTTELLFLDSENKLAGIRYERDKPHTEWFNKKMKNHQNTLNDMYKEYYAEIFDWNYDATILLVRLFSDVDPGHIIIFNTQTKTPVFFWTYANELLNYEVSNTKIINYKSRDGQEIEGYLNFPLNGDGNWPFIIMPHGGPWARDHWRYDPVVQFFANQGYGILRMNYRGSTGYGTDHLLSGVKKISSVMIDDIADGTKWAIDNNYADSTNIFLYGHSYGGYSALQSIIRYPELYNAAVSVAGLTDLIKMTDYYKKEKNDFNYEFWKAVVGDPKNEKKHLKKISPINNIKNINRPIFLFHGENDRIVPVEQTTKFIEKAEKLDKKIDFKIIQDEDHSISENRNKEFILRKSIQFFKENSNEND